MSRLECVLVVFCAVLLNSGCQPETPADALARRIQENFKSQAEEAAVIKFEIIGTPTIKHAAHVQYGECVAKIKNLSGEAVSGISGELHLVDPARSVPWYVKSFRKDIPGGIEPGETVEVAFTAGSYGTNQTMPIDIEDYPKAKWRINLNNGEPVFGVAPVRVRQKPKPILDFGFQQQPQKPVKGHPPVGSVQKHIWDGDKWVAGPWVDPETGKEVDVAK